MKQSAETERFAFLLDRQSGVPVYRQLIDQVQAGMAAGTLKVGDQLPTVRQVAVDMAINPNTVMRAYREMEIRGLIDTQQGTGTFVSDRGKAADGPEERERRLAALASEMASRAGAGGFTLRELIEALRELEAR
jgi:GntR family transcriptional regulator